MRRRVAAARLSAGWLLAWGGLVWSSLLVNGCVDKFVACGSPGARRCQTSIGGDGGEPPISPGGGGAGGAGGTEPLPPQQGGMGGEPPIPPPTCKKEGSSTCLGEAQSRYSICRDGLLLEEECESGLLCDRKDGKCKKPVEACVNRKPGEGYCEVDVLNVCGPDLVTLHPTQCEGACSEGECQNPTCGDGKQAEGEACDDLNTTPGDGCSANCQLEPIRIESGAATSCALFLNGDLKCWGSNTYGQLGVGDTLNRGDDAGELGANLNVAMTNVTHFAVGKRHVCAAVEEGGVFCWGDDSTGQLGRGGPPDGAAVEYETRAVATLVPATTKVIALTAGDWHTCALMKDQKLYCWGGNTQAQLGIGKGSEYYPRRDDGDDDQLIAVDLGGVPPRAIGAGLDLTCALLDTELRCWGANSEGQSGVSSKGDPVVIPKESVNLGSFPIASFAVGQSHVCARSENGDVKCWGSNGSGQLGYGNLDPVGEDPKKMGSALGLSIAGSLGIHTGDASTCATLNNGKAVCWGSNRSGALGQPYSLFNENIGDELSEINSLPQLDFGSEEKIKSLSLGGSFGCALLESGRIKCWGANESGQLGVGDTESHGDAEGEMGDALGYTWLGAEDDSSLPRRR